MAKENPTEEITKPEGEVSQTPEEDAWTSGMEGKYPELKGNREALFKASREGYDKEHEYNKQNAEDYKKIYDGIQKSPEMARFVKGLTEQEDGAMAEEALAELGEDLVDLLTGKVDAPAYRKKRGEMQAAKDAEEKLKEDAAAAFTEACGEIGIDEKEAYDQLMSKYGDGNGSFLADKGFFVALLKSLSYEDDMLAAEARGRNAQMSEKKMARGASTDGLPNSKAGGGASKGYDPNSLAAVYARKAQMNR